MALYPREDNEQHIAPEQLTSSVGAIFRACGIFETDAHTVADSLVHAGLRGIHSHGVLRVPDYVKEMTVKGVDPKGQPRVVSETGGAICIDGANSMVQVGGKFATKLAIERTREIGVTFAAVGGSNHCGAMDYYTLPAAENDLVRLAGTNTLPTMAPWRGVDKIFGLNTLSVALLGDAVPSIIMEFALGTTAHGKIRVFAQKRRVYSGEVGFRHARRADHRCGSGTLRIFSALGRPQGYRACHDHGPAVRPVYRHGVWNRAGQYG